MPDDMIVIDAAGDTIILGEAAGAAPYFENDDEIIVIDRVGPQGPPGTPGPPGPAVPGPSGPQGPAGPAGTSAGRGFRYVQSAPTTRWDVHHTLEALRPTVQVTRSDGGLVYGRIDYLAAGHLTISFSAAIAGEAYLT